MQQQGLVARCRLGHRSVYGAWAVPVAFAYALGLPGAAARDHMKDEHQKSLPTLIHIKAQAI
jgi:hypothetical protein